MSAIDRPSAPISGDDNVLPFAVEALDLRGRLVRLGPAVDAILGRHDYPPCVSRLLAEAVALTALIGTSMKFDGRFILQTQSDGPVSMLVVDFSAPESLRACARFDAAAVAAAVEAGRDRPEDLLGRGHLAMTVDQGAEMSRYQGIVELDGRSLEEAAHGYFLQSEQIPTRVRLAVAEVLTRDPGREPHRAWRAGGLFLQFLPASAERVGHRDLHPGDAPGAAATLEEDDAWVEALSLAGTVEDVELTDPAVSAETLLYRLFHERGARVFEPQPLVERCRCSRDAVRAMIASFSPAERVDMVENGRIGVTCEFCSTRYDFDPKEFETPEEG